MAPQHKGKSIANSAWDHHWWQACKRVEQSRVQIAEWVTEYLLTSIQGTTFQNTRNGLKGPLSHLKINKTNQSRELLKKPQRCSYFSTYASTKSVTIIWSRNANNLNKVRELGAWHRGLWQLTSGKRLGTWCAVAGWTPLATTILWWTVSQMELAWCRWGWQHPLAAELLVALKKKGSLWAQGIRTG